MNAPMLVSSEKGRIRSVLFAFPAAALTAFPSLPDAFAMALRDDIQGQVVTHAAVAAEVCGRFPDGTIVSAVPDDAPLSVWIQDQSLAFERAGEGPLVSAGPRLTLPDTLDRRGDELVPLDGGNLLVGSDYALVGRDELAFWQARRPVRPPQDPDAALALFAADYGLPARVVPVGEAPPSESPFGRTEWRGAEPWRIDPDPGIVAKGSRQAVFHIDVYVTPAGRDETGRPRLLVGDPCLAADLAGLEPPPSAFAARFDADAAALSAAGFSVVRNPLPATAVDHPHRRRRTRHILSPNNAWVETEEGRPGRAWVPQFGAGPGDPLSIVDAAMTALWRSLGFEPVAVAGLLPLALRNGGLNCASRILRRV